MPLDQIITSVHQVDSGNAIAITTQDGSTATYNPSTMSQLYLETDINEVTSMSQSGFTFPINPHPLQLAFSPTGCVSVSLDPDGKLELASMEYHSGIDTTPTPDPGLDTALASISLSFVRACYSTSSSDDIVLCILRSLRPNQQPQLLSSMYQSLFRDADLIAAGPGSDLDKLPRNQMVAKILGLQAALGYTSTTAHLRPSTNGSTNGIKQPLPSRNLVSIYAWMTLNLRYVAVHVYVTLSSAKAATSEYAEPDILDVICANIRWSLDLFKLIVSDLFEMAEAAETHRQQQQATPAGVAGGASSPLLVDATPTSALSTLLISTLWSRFFLRTISRCFRGILGVPKAAPQQHAIEGASVLAFARMAQTVEAAGLPLEAFERLLGGADKFVAQAYAEAGFGERERADTERGLMATGRIAGTVLAGVVGRLCEEVLPMTREEVDRLGLFVGDWAWVTLQAGVVGRGAGMGEGPVDVHRKKVLKQRLDTEVRRCVRCACVSRDVPGPPKGWPKFTAQQGMRCVCESGFVIERLGDV